MTQTRNPLVKPYGLKITDADGRTSERWFSTQAERMEAEMHLMWKVWKVERVDNNAVV